MFVGFSKRLRGMSGLRFGFGMRVTKRNMWYMLIISSFAAMMWVMWQLLVLGMWSLYWMYYFMLVWPYKKIYALLKARKAKTSEDGITS